VSVRNADTADLVVVGAGPVGLFAAFYAGLRGLDVTIVDSLSEPGGQVTALYPEKAIRDVAGLPSVRGRDLIVSLLHQVEPFQPTWKLGSTATTVTEVGNGYTIGCTAKLSSTSACGRIGWECSRPAISARMPDASR
jgi:thioredoxin reductase (NADPH)